MFSQKTEFRIFKPRSSVWQKQNPFMKIWNSFVVKTFGEQLKSPEKNDCPIKNWPVQDHDCYVFLGCRDVGRGATAMKSILDEVPEKADKIEVLQIDVGEY